MNPHQNNLDPQEQLDQATAERLAKLRHMPIDTSRLDRLLRSQVPVPMKPSRLSIWLRPMRAAAALLLVTGVATALVLFNSGQRALASPAQMAQMHEEIISGKTPVMQVASIGEANQALAAQWPDSPGIPTLPADHVMACCMNSGKNKKVACVLLKNEGEPVTLTVANASDMKLPTSPTAVRDGITYHVQSSGSLNMVMTERNARWVCLIARMPVNQLMDLATKLRF